MATLNFESTGSGKPVVALHGYGSTLFSWRFLPPALPNRRVVRIDLPGHGGSAARPDGRYALSDHAQQVINFIEGEDFGEFDLIGHSLGGGVALSIVAELSTRKVSPIKSLTLVDSVALPQSLPWFLGLARVPGLGSFLLSALRRQTIAAALRTAFYDPRRVTEEMLQVYARNLVTREGRQAADSDSPPNLPQRSAFAHRKLSPSKAADFADMGKAGRHRAAVDRGCIEWPHRGLKVGLDRRLWPYSSGRATGCRHFGDR